MDRSRCRPGVVGTLLGPEGADRGWRVNLRSGPLLRVQGRPVPHTAVPRECLGVRVWWGRVGGVWSYVENCTVDASIF